MKGLIQQCCSEELRQRERGGELYSVAGGLTMGGMEECTVGEGGKGGGNLPLNLCKKNLWGQPIRG